MKWKCKDSHLKKCCAMDKVKSTWIQMDFSQDEVMVAMASIFFRELEFGG